VDGRLTAAEARARVRSSGARPAGSRWLRGLEVDLRSLALFRVAMGLVILADLALRLPLLRPLYTDAGVLPREALLGLSGSHFPSLHLVSGSWGWQLALLLLAALLAVGFTLGYRTRLCAAGSWFLLLSLHARNPFVLHGGDAVLRLLLFWSIFAPLNQRFSLDRALNPGARLLPDRHISPASLALVFQICGIYWFAAAEKMHPVWLGEQSAVYYALSLDQFATPIGRFLLGYPGLLQLMTTGTLLLELFGPLLAISPFYTTALRILVPCGFIGFHLGLALTMWLDLFPWVCIGAWLAFMPGAVWDRLRIGRPTQDPGAAVPRGFWRPPPPRPVGVSGSLAVLFFLVLATASFVDAVPGGRRSPLRQLLRATMMDQSWRMFAPYPSAEDGWFVIEGLRRDGKAFDVWNGGGTPTDDKPANLRDRAYPNTQWLAYLSGLRSDRKRDYRPYFGRYLCRTWNEGHDGIDGVRLVVIRYLVEITPPPGRPAYPAVPEVVWLQPCVA
jgi:hypothetical protein